MKRKDLFSHSTVTNIYQLKLNNDDVMLIFRGKRNAKEILIDFTDWSVHSRNYFVVFFFFIYLNEIEKKNKLA